MSVIVKLRFVRHSARKLQPMVRVIAGKQLQDALNTTAVMSQDSASQVHKALKMAEAAAGQKEFDTSKLVVEQIFATQGPRIRRQRPNARGRSNAYQKHLAHITIILGEAKPQVDKKTNKKAVEKKTQVEKVEPKISSSAKKTTKGKE